MKSPLTSLQTNTNGDRRLHMTIKNNKNLHMKIEQIYTGCLAQGAYYIVSNGEAAIIDPLREVQPYLERLEKDNVKLKYILKRISTQILFLVT